MAVDTTAIALDTDFVLLGERIQEAMARLQIPGVAVGLTYQDRDHVAGFGVTNVNHPLPVDADTLFQIGSTTKTITATMAMRLVEQGKLDLDVPIRTYLPDLRLADEDVAAQVTLRHLFTHGGGWQGDFFDDTGSGDDALAQIVARLANLKQVLPLGAAFSYNNAGFYLAGRTIEAVAGKTYEALARELVLDPLGMTRSFFFAKDVITDRVAVGHRVGDDGPTVLREWALARASNPVGGLVSAPGDQLRYARFHMGDGTAPDGAQLLTPASLALMQTPQGPLGNGLDAIGLTWMLKDIGGVRVVQHGGATNGQMSAFLFVPERGFALTILTNADRGATLNHEITDWALEHYLGLRAPDPVYLDTQLEALVPYAGRYSSIGSDLDIVVGADSLIAQVIPKPGFPTSKSPVRPTPPPAPLARIGEDTFIVVEGPLKDAHAAFLRHPDGRLMGVRLGLRILMRED